MRIQNIHAHFDDFEFTAAGTFELWRQAGGADWAAEIVVCTDGAAGHHRMTREETAARRLAEQRAAGAIGGYTVHPLQYADGSFPREGCLHAAPQLLGALWKAIRDFQPDYLFCPPVPAEPLSGVHADHLAVAESLRRVAYFINVPHAFSVEYPGGPEPAEFVKTPAILNVYDGYMTGGNAFDLAVRIDDVFDSVAEQSWQHQSQIVEWLPWVSGQPGSEPKNLAEWKRILRQRCLKQNRDVGLETNHLYEFFTLTGWGCYPALEQLLADIPGIDRQVSRLDQLAARIARFQA